MAATKNIWSVPEQGNIRWTSVPKTKTKDAQLSGKLKGRTGGRYSWTLNVVPTVTVVPYVYRCIDEDENVCCKKCLTRTWTGEHNVDIRTKKKKTKDAQLSGKKACRWLPRIVILSHATQTQCEWNCQGKYVPCLCVAPGRAHEPRNKTK